MIERLPANFPLKLQQANALKSIKKTDLLLKAALTEDIRKGTITKAGKQICYNLRIVNQEEKQNVILL